MQLIRSHCYQVLLLSIPVNFKATFIEGITKIDKYDFVFAKELGYSIKLLSVASKKLSKIEQRVHPCFVKQNQILQK